MKFSSIQLMCVMYLIAWMISPPLSYDFIYRIMALVCVIIWILIYISNPHKNAGELKIYLFCTVIYSLTLLSFRMIFDHMSLFGALYSDITTYILLVSGYIGGVYTLEKRFDDLKKILVEVIIIAVVFSITSIFRSPKYEGLTRNAGGTADLSYNYLAREAALHGVGAFGFFCFASVFAPVLLWYAFSCKGIKKLQMIICTVIVETGVFSAGYTIALTLSVIGLGLVVISRLRSPIIKMIIFLLIILFLIAWNEISTNLYFVLTNLTQGTMYSNKVNDIFGFLLNGESAGSFDARQERYLMSLRSMFLDYPIIGSYIFAGTRNVGYHSSILDTFAAYGWGIGVVWTYLISLFPSKTSSGAGKGYKTICALLLFLTGLLNQYVMMMGVFYFVIPAVASIDHEVWVTREGRL